MRALLLLALLALGAAQARLLQQQAEVCVAAASAWTWSDQCYNATGQTPPPKVEKADSTALPPRWGCAQSDDANCTGNPFFSADQPLVRAAQGFVSGGTLGFRTGGSQDVMNFRQNIEAGLLPLPTDMGFEGLIKEYYFNTQGPNTTEPCRELFCPVYSLAVSPDPLRAAAAAARRRSLLQDGGAGVGGTAPESEVFLAVGLDSGINASEFKRPARLNVVLLLDVSGSMGAPFDSYYYDATGKQLNLTEQEANTTKIDVAKEVIRGIAGLLAPNDTFSVVIFSDGACAPKQQGPVSCTDVPALQRAVERDINATSGTNLEAGLEEATKQLTGCQECMSSVRKDPASVENRVILVTDAQPNQGMLNTTVLAKRLSDSADKGIHTTIIGVGLDFNTELTEAISKVKGMLYFSVHSPGEFQRRLVQDFDYAVTPTVFDLALEVAPSALAPANATQTDSWRMLHVYGSPMPNDTALSGNGTVMSISTLFPTPKSEEGIKGGVVLVRMAAPNATADGSLPPLDLSVSYTDRAGKRHSSNRTVDLPPQFAAAAASPAAAPISFFGSSGVRKALLLARYSDLLQTWLVDEWEGLGGPNKTVVLNQTLCAVFPSQFCPSVDAQAAYRVAAAGAGRCELGAWLLPDACILPLPTLVVGELGQWERTSENLTVNARAKEAMRVFLPHFEGEMAAVNDTSLQQEVDLLTKLINA